MSSMYIRVPHYVASYFRHRNERKPVAMGCKVSVENEPQLWDMLMHGLGGNPLERLHADGCFCERMWRKMLRGCSLAVGGQNLQPAPRTRRDAREPLTDAEVRQLCGWEPAHNNESDEYLCVELPPFIYAEGRQVVVDGQYQFTSRNCIRQFQAEMRREFWNACIGYIDEFLRVSKRKGYDRTKMEGLERFMLRYDIRSGPNDRTKKTLKRSYYRQLMLRQHLQYDFVEFGESSD
ncbi:MAG: hypothetical protein IJ557_02515 [Bacteroidaceae bacterium]|nr:hypothetical protein [Bacteroidaceae bacterium]